MVFTLRCYWPLSRSLKFWAFLLVYLGVLATSIMLWPFTGTPNFLWVGAVGGIEFGIFALVTQRVFHVTPRQKGEGHNPKRSELRIGDDITKSASRRAE